MQDPQSGLEGIDGRPSGLEPQSASIPIGIRAAPDTREKSVLPVASWLTPDDADVEPVASRTAPDSAVAIAGSEVARESSSAVPAVAAAGVEASWLNSNTPSAVVESDPNLVDGDPAVDSSRRAAGVGAALGFGKCWTWLSHHRRDLAIVIGPAALLVTVLVLWRSVRHHPAKSHAGLAMSLVRPASSVVMPSLSSKAWQARQETTPHVEVLPEPVDDVAENGGARGGEEIWLDDLEPSPQPSSARVAADPRRPGGRGAPASSSKATEPSRKAGGGKRGEPAGVEAHEKSPGTIDTRYDPNEI